MLPNRENLSSVPFGPIVAAATRSAAAFLSASFAAGAWAEQAASSAQVSVGAGGIGLGVGGGAVAPFSQAPLSNSVDWIDHCASRGGTVDEGVDFEHHPIGDLLGDFYLCSHGVAMNAQAMTWVRAGTGAETGAVNGVVSPGEGVLPPSRYLLNGEPGAWSLTITFRRPVSGAGLMSADLYNPAGVSGLTLRAYAGAAATGDMLAETTSPSICFQHNHRYFIGVSDDAARIRSIVLNCPNAHLDTVFLEYLAFSTSASPSILDGDVNGDAAIDDRDMNALLAAWGDPECVAADLDESGMVDGADLGILLSQIATAVPQGPVSQNDAQSASAGGSSAEGVTASADASHEGATDGDFASASAMATPSAALAAPAPAAARFSAQAADAAYHATSSAASPSASVWATVGGAAANWRGSRRFARWHPAWIGWTSSLRPTQIVTDDGADHRVVDPSKPKNPPIDHRREGQNPSTGQRSPTTGDA